MVKTDLTKELILLTGTGLCQSFKEEVALAGNGLEHRSQNAQVQQQGSTGGKVLTEVQVDHTDGSDHAGQGDTVDVTGGGNHGQTVLNSVSVDLEQGHSVTPQAQAIGGSVGTVNLLHHVSNVPQTEGLATHSGGVGGDSSHQTTGLVHGSVRGGLVELAVDEGVLNVGVDLRHLRRHLKIQLVHGVGLLTSDIQAGQSTHVRHLPVGNAHRLLKDLSDIGLLLTGDNGRFGSGQRSSLRNGGLRTAAGGVLLTGHELDMIGDLGSAADDGGQRGAGVALVKEHTGVIQHSEAGSQSISHCKSLLYSFCFA